MYCVEHTVRLAMGTTVNWENCFYVTIIQVEKFCNLSIHECFSILTVLLWTPMVTSTCLYRPTPRAFTMRLTASLVPRLR